VGSEKRTKGKKGKREKAKEKKTRGKTRGSMEKNKAAILLPY